MEALREFLESSTIHGLSYISTAPTKASKALWLAVVVTGFFTAGYLINSSYKEWQASPISTSISTHPISELDFPTISVCPPKGSNTVLNYDLMRTAKITLTDEDRQSLVNLSKLLIHRPAEQFIKQSLTMTNRNNILHLFGIQSEQTYPFPYVDEIGNRPGFNIWSSALTGNFTSPGFGQPIDCNKTYPNIHFTLLMPFEHQDLKNEKLRLKVQVENDQAIEMKFREGSKLISFSDAKKTREDAELFCVQQKGNLASLRNFKDFDTISRGCNGKAWIGGSDEAVEDKWLWPDGSAVSAKLGRKCNDLTKEEENTNTLCNMWGANQPAGGRDKNCLSISQGQFLAENCDYKFDFWCEFESNKVLYSKERTFELSKSQFTQLEFWWQSINTLTKNECSPDKRMPGFSTNWKITNGTKYNLDKMSWKHSKDYKDVKSTFDVLKGQMLRMVLHAKGHNMTNSQIWDIVFLHKDNIITANVVQCESGFAHTDKFYKVFSALKPKLLENLPKVEYEISTEDYVFTYEIFSYLIFCDEEANQVYSFYNDLLHTESASGILQATVNNLNLPDLKEETKAPLKQIYLKIMELFGLQSANILRALSDTETTKSMELDDYVFIKRNRNRNDNVGRFDSTYLC